jgi:hypothetical protein
VNKNICGYETRPKKKKFSNGRNTGWGITLIHVPVNAKIAIKNSKKEPYCLFFFAANTQRNKEVLV